MLDNFSNTIYTALFAPLFRQDLAAPYGTSGQNAVLDNFSNTIYTALFAPPNLRTPSGRTVLHGLAGQGGDQLADDDAAVLKTTGVTNYPYVKTSTTGVRVDNAKLLDLNAYLASLPAPKGVVKGASAAARGRDVFRANCTTCHNVDQGNPVNAALMPMRTIWPG